MASQNSGMPVCPVATTLGLLDSKWKVLILRNLLVGPSRYSEIMATIPGISSKMMSESLRSMEADGIIVREEGGNSRVVTYRLSELGETLRPVIDAMRVWGTEYLRNNPGNQ